jgi:hypothetical protein
MELFLPKGSCDWRGIEKVETEVWFVGWDQNISQHCQGKSYHLLVFQPCIWVSTISVILPQWSAVILLHFSEFHVTNLLLHGEHYFFISGRSIWLYVALLQLCMCTVQLSVLVYCIVAIVYWTVQLIICCFIVTVHVHSSAGCMLHYYSTCAQSSWLCVLYYCSSVLNSPAVHMLCYCHCACAQSSWLCVCCIITLVYVKGSILIAVSLAVMPLHDVFLPHTSLNFLSFMLILHRMKQLLENDLHCVILTSGTLSPLPSLMSELGIPIPVTLENPHVIGSGQVFVSVISTGPDGFALNSSYNTRCVLDLDFLF